MKNKKDICDCNGFTVQVGSMVKVLKISDSLLSDLPDVEIKDLQSMVGEIFTVYEIDEYGGVWVEKWFEENSENPYSHSLSLFSDEMELLKK